MKQLLNITALHYCNNGQAYEATYSFIRKRSAPKPTFTGAARMIARLFNDDRRDESEPITKPSDISVCRIECSLYV